MTLDLDFKPLVEKLARDNFINITIGEEDVRQELWRKVQELLPSIIKHYDPVVDRSHIFRHVKVCLNNLIKDLKYSESRTPGASQYSLMDIDLSELLGDEVTSIFERLSDHNQEDFMIARELNELIMTWASKQTDLIKKFINERIETSQEVEEKWEERLKTSPRCKNAKSIPIWSLLDILGINQREYYKKIRIELAEFLGQHGYQVYH